MRKADRILGFVLVALSIYIITTASKLVLWTTGADSAPGPGFLPMFAGTLMLLLSAALIAKSFIGKKYNDSESSVFTRSGLRDMVYIIGSAAVASILVNIVGFVISIGLMGGFLTFAFSEEKDYKLTGIITVTLPIVLYIIFKVGLEVQLPVGIFGF